MSIGFESQSVWQARGRGFQMGVVQPEGLTVRLTGQVAWDENETVVGLGILRHKRVSVLRIFANCWKL